MIRFVDVEQLNSTRTGWDILTLQGQMEDNEEKDGLGHFLFQFPELIFENTPAGGAKIFIFDIFILPINEIGNHLSTSLNVDSIITL